MCMAKGQDKHSVHAHWSRTSLYGVMVCRWGADVVVL